ncbi:MAG: type II toxin-antitoxin system PemK/MazF family toxin [Cellulosilyticum sp.]|nr:type II toxin-antitoxin system PemK/MazF family toxin [Cellulosilyticum sp.]
MELCKYDIVYVRELGSFVGSMQHFDRPAIILQNNKGNIFSRTVIVAMITSNTKRTDIPTHVLLKNYKLWKPSMVMLEQIFTIDKSLIAEKIDHLRVEDCIKVDAAMLVSLGCIPIESRCVHE